MVAKYILPTWTSILVPMHTIIFNVEPVPQGDNDSCCQQRDPYLEGLF